MTKKLYSVSILGLITLSTLAACGTGERSRSAGACVEMAAGGLRKVADERDRRFEGKVAEATARCRGGDDAVEQRSAPWVDWSNYWATGDEASRRNDFLTRLEQTFRLKHTNPNGRGVDGALLDLEYQRIELIKFNLFDNSGTYEGYVAGRDGVDGPALKVWDAMRLPPDDPHFSAVGGDGEQVCSGELIRHRTLSGICNDLFNPRMGAAGMPFARNVTFESTFPDLGRDELARNRHGGRIGPLQPDPALISRRLFRREGGDPGRCNGGHGLPGWSAEADCPYAPAPFFNVLAAFWIQFMTHDWFSHLEEGRNSEAKTSLGCARKLVDGAAVDLTAEEVAALGCRPGDTIGRARFLADAPAPTFAAADGATHLARAPKTTANTVTAWWDASQIYGHDERSRTRVKRDPADPAKLLLEPVRGEALGYLPLLSDDDPMNPAWRGQEATAFPDNWTIGMSFYHNVFAREHNLFVDEWRRRQRAAPDADSGLRHPLRPDAPISYAEATDDEVFEVARLVVAAEIAKIHTIEWTTQLLYDEPLFLAMNSNWSGLFGDGIVSRAVEKVVTQSFGPSEDARKANQWYSVFASGAGIFGLGNRVYRDGAAFALYDPEKTDVWDLTNPRHVNGGVNHFGSPFNFPEEFVTVYRLHPLVPDLIELRDAAADPNAITHRVPVVETFRAPATAAMRDHGLASWALSMGRQRLGGLTLGNHARFHQDLVISRPGEPERRIDVAALDLVRDRERGVPRFNEFRRQYGLRQLSSFDDFVDRRLLEGSPQRAEQERLVGVLREVYGQHVCDDSKPITAAQRMPDGSPVTDCLGHPDGTLVDNVEDLDTVVGWLAEFARPHGFAISETQFQVFILNASRRLFSDRFFTSSFRPEIYGHLGVAWVNDNGPDGERWERGKPNGHRMEVTPLKRVLQRTLPELAGELDHVVNAFDPWARDRGRYYSLDWKPRPGAEADPAFAGGR